MKGSYFLVIRLKGDREIRTKGRTFRLREGHYVYVGSAMNSLEKRVARHFRKDKKHHWHIDFLLKEAELLRAYLIPSEERLEERLSQEVARRGEPVPGFGAGDVSVNTNLYRFEGEPDETLTEILRGLGLDWKIVKSEEEIKELGEKDDRDRKGRALHSREAQK
jgi:Uri superfamily endonuclease